MRRKGEVEEEGEEDAMLRIKPSGFSYLSRQAKSLLMASAKNQGIPP